MDIHTRGMSSSMIQDLINDNNIFLSDRNTFIT